MTTIRVGDTEDVPITKSLRNALRMLRKPTISRLLWIDALCINQADVEERSHQVSFMDEIYREAHTVLIWLGPGTEYSFYGMEALKSFSGGALTPSQAPWSTGPPHQWLSGLQDVMTNRWFS